MIHNQEAEEQKPKTPFELKIELIGAISHEANQSIQVLTLVSQLASGEVGTPELLSAGDAFYHFSRSLREQRNTIVHEHSEVVQKGGTEDLITDTETKVDILQEFSCEIISQMEQAIQQYNKALTSIENTVDIGSLEEAQSQNVVGAREALERMNIVLTSLRNIQSYKLKAYVNGSIVDLRGSSGGERSGASMHG